MEVWFSLGRATLALVQPDRRLEQYVRHEMDPYEPAAAGATAPDIRIERSSSRPTIVDMQGDAGDGRVSGVDEAAFYVFEDGGGWWSLRAEAEKYHLRLSDDLPGWRVFAPVVRPLLQLALHRHGGVAVHGSSVVIDGSGVVVAGWSESGKTETVLAMMESGARFVSDKWTIVSDDGQIAPFPAAVFLRRWVIPYLPRLRASLSLGARGHLVAGRLAAGLAGPVGRLGAAGPALAFVAGSYERLVPLADRLRLSPSELRTLYGEPDQPRHDGSLGAIALLTTTPGGDPSVREADPTWAARRLARSAAFERRTFYELLLREGYARPGSEHRSLAGDVEHEARFLEACLGRVRVLEVRAPFPTDPRRVADAITGAL